MLAEQQYSLRLSAVLLSVHDHRSYHWEQPEQNFTNVDQRVYEDRDILSLVGACGATLNIGRSAGWKPAANL